MKKAKRCEEEKVNINQYQFKCVIEMIDIGFYYIAKWFGIKVLIFIYKPLHIIVRCQKIGLLDNVESLLIASLGL